MPSGAGAKDDPKGLYSTLGISSTAHEDDIRKAYRRLALRWHPDKNPDDPSATEQFQRISSAYEVLSDPKKRQMYDSTGCIDDEELMGGEGDFAAEMFARFFGSMNEDLDDDEQAMMDEFLHLAGASAFKVGRGRRRGKKGRGGRGGGGFRTGASAARQQEEMFEEVLMSAMAGGMGGMGGMSTEAAPVCPEGHDLKKRKAEAPDYECDVCSKDILVAKRFYDCRKCDWSICQKCYKQKQAELEEEQQVDEEDLCDQAEILEAFCEMHSSVVRKGARLQHKCDICNAVLKSAEEVLPHMEDNHIDVIEAFLEESLSAGAGGGASPFGFPGMGGGMPAGMEEEILMSMMMGGMMPGMPGGSSSKGYPGGSGRRKKR